MALAHTIGNKAEANYRQGDLFEKRRALMTECVAWFEPMPETVVALIPSQTGSLGR